MGIRISKDHLHPSVIESVTSGIGDVSKLETDAKGNAVEAINELLEKRDRTKELEADLAEGKELIAEAVGEPLSKDDSFQDMSNDIKGLLSQFKTNMMNSGVVVESGDKFKVLIDKIKGLTEGEGNKGIQYAEGDCSGYALIYDGYSRNIVINHNLGFIPQLFFVSMSVTNVEITKCNVIVSNLNEMRVNTADTRFNISVNITDISEDNCTLTVARDVLMGDNTTFTASKWFAIGVGEEDNTLRDSLASILEEEGMEVTEEDDMASLIAKVDEEFDIQNNEIDSLNTELVECRDTLKQILIDKNVQNLEDENKLSALIDKVGEIKAFPSYVDIGDNFIIYNDTKEYVPVYATLYDLLTFKNFVLPGSYRVSLDYRAKSTNPDYESAVVILHMTSSNDVITSKGVYNQVDTTYKRATFDFTNIEPGHKLIFQTRYCDFKNITITCNLTL